MQDFLQCKELYDEASEKAYPPAQVQEIFGYEIDSCSMEIQVSDSKVKQLIELCTLFHSK